MLAECSRRAEVKAKLDDEVKELKNLVEELKVDTIEKDTRLDHLQKRSNKLSILLGRPKEKPSRSLRHPTSSLTFWSGTMLRGLKTLSMDAMEHFPEVDFSLIKLNIAARSSLLHTSSEDVNIEDDTYTQPAIDNPKSGENPSNGL